MATSDEKIKGQVCLLCLTELFGSESTNCDLKLYQRFLHFNNGYFELGPVLDKFLKGVEELAVSKSSVDVVGDNATSTASSQSQARVVVKAFCSKCKDWVADLCDLYDQLQSVKTHLMVTMTKAEAILISNPSGQKSQDAFDTLSEQLNVKEWKEVESFRQTLLAKCREESIGNVPYEISKEYQVKSEPIESDLFYKSGDSENGDGMFHEDNFTIPKPELQEGRRRSTRVRTQKRKFVSDYEDDFDDDNDPVKCNTKKEAESDSDWSDVGATLPVDCDNYSSEHEQSDVNDDINEDIDSLPEDVSSSLPSKKKKSKMLKQLRSSSKTSDEDTQERSNSKEAKKTAGARTKEKVVEKKGTYMCPKCPEIVPTRTKLSEHLHTAHKVSPDAHFCEMCGKECDTFEILTHHKRRNHEIGKNGILTLEERQCYICDGIFLKPSHRKRHLIRVHGITDFEKPIKKSSLTPKPKDRSCRCRQCNQKFLTPTEFRRHLLANKHDHVVLCCPTCPKIFTEEEALQGHLEVHETMTEPYFYCESCAHTFIQETFLQKHMKNVHNNKFVCNQCNTKLKTPKELRHHLETHETSVKSHRCVYCAREFSGQQYYDIHRKVVHCDKRRRFYCDMEKCGEDFETVEELHEHMQEHVREKEGTQIFNCDTCKQGFFNELSATLHKLVHVPPNDKENSDFGFTCPECTKPLTYKHSLFLHYQRCHMKSVSCHFSSSDSLKTQFNKYEYDETWPIPCYFCHERFLSKERLEVHIKERKGHVRRMTIGFVCDNEECMEKCGSISELDDHLKSHSKGDNEVHRCTFCSWPFLSEGRLEVHQLEHSKKGESGFECPKCDQVFSTQAHLVGHYKRFHAKVKTFINCANCGSNFRTLTRFNEHTTQECQDFASGKSCLAEFACTFEGCQKTFYARGSLVAHVNTTHAKSKNFVCDICGAQFAFRTLLKEHGICHQEKKYECPICHKKFARKSAVIKHKPIHDPDRPAAFVCSICGASFKTESGMRYHTTAIHTQVEKKLFTCQHPNCSKSYRRRSVLTKHVKKCHPKDETGNLSRIGGRDEGIPSSDIL